MAVRRPLDGDCRDTHAVLLCLIGLFALGSAVVGGVFFAFSSFLLRSLAQLPPGTAVLAMQRINVVVLGSLFLAVFMGTAALGLVCAAWAWMAWPSHQASLVVLAALSYALGSLAVTVIFNVPLNERLARADADSPDAATHWARYLRQWGRWNGIRTIASVMSSALAIAAIAISTGTALT